MKYEMASNTVERAVLKTNGEDNGKADFKWVDFYI